MIKIPTNEPCPGLDSRAWLFHLRVAGQGLAETGEPGPAKSEAPEPDSSPALPLAPCSAVCLLSCLRELLVADAHAACMGSGECCTPVKGFWDAVLSLLTDYGLWDAFLCLLIADRCLKT